MKFPFQALILGVSFLALSGCASTSGSRGSKESRFDGLLNLAAASISEGDSISALEYLNQAQEINDSNSQEYYLYSLAYLGKKEIRLATDSARRAVQLNPKFSAAKNTLGKLLMDQGKYAEAEKYLLESANDLLNREADLPKINLGILYFKTLKYAKAEQWLTRAAEEKSAMSCMASFYLGKINLEKNELPMAERNFVTASKGSCSGMADAHLAIGQTLVRQKKYDQARAKFVEIQRIFPSSDVSDKASNYLRELP